MKKFTHLIKLSLLLFGAVLLKTSATAQQSVHIMQDSLFFYSSSCPTPVTGGIDVNGYATNYNSATDSIVIQVQWGDGTFSLDTVDLYEAGSNDYFWLSLNHTYTLPGVYFVQVIATAPNLIADTADALDSVYVSSFCTQFDGLAYQDLNANCTYNSTDSLLPHTRLTVLNSSGVVVASTWSDMNGYYSFTLPSNMSNLTISAYKYPMYVTTCPSGGSYTFNTNTSQSFDFGLECPSNGFDKYIYTWGSTAAPGDTGRICVYAHALHCGTYGALADTVILELDSNVNYLGQLYSAPAPDVISGNTLTWYTNWTYYSSYSSRIFYACYSTITDTGATMYDTACYTANFASPTNDINPNNDMSHWCWPIGVPYDPNNKLSFPQGEGPEGKIDTSIHQLTYRINFQNTGTAPAQNVYVLDSIPAELDVHSIEILSSSHPMKLMWQQDNRVRFDFPNINLPDSASDPEGSQGFVDFMITRDPNLALGTQIKNRVGIYFDYNAPVVTNYAINTLYIAPIAVTPLVISVTGSDVTCMNNDNGSAVLQIVSGNPPYAYNWSNGSNTASIDELAPGSYTVTVTDNEGQIEQAMVVVAENRIHPDPVVGEITGDASVQSWEPYFYEVDAKIGSNYEWLAEGGEIVQANSNVAEVLWHAGPQAKITVYETDANGCIGEESADIVIEFVGTEELNKMGIQLFPNPSSDHINVVMPGNTESAIIQLHDAQGRIVLSESLRAGQNLLDVSSLSNGIYTANIQFNDAYFHTKIVKK